MATLQQLTCASQARISADQGPESQGLMIEPRSSAGFLIDRRENSRACRRPCRHTCRYPPLYDPEEIRVPKLLRERDQNKNPPLSS
jgi:hypothetical protein